MIAIPWRISDADGKPLGLYSAVAPETAFCLYLRDHGIDISEQQVDVRSVFIDSVMIRFRSKEFFLLAMSQERVGRQPI
jgi:hypothetical protein